MSILEIWLISLCAFLWISGGVLVYKAGVKLGMAKESQAGYCVAVALWPFVTLYVMLGG